MLAPGAAVEVVFDPVKGTLVVGRDATDELVGAERTDADCVRASGEVIEEEGPNAGARVEEGEGDGDDPGETAAGWEAGSSVLPEEEVGCTGEERDASTSLTSRRFCPEE